MMMEQSKPLFLKSLVICLVLLSLVSPQTFGQHIEKKTQDSLESIPLHLRKRLLERLQLLVEYQGNKQWDKEYELLSKTFIQGKSKDEFIKESNRVVQDPYISTLFAFKPTSAVLVYNLPNDAEWSIFGCGTYSRKGLLVKVEAVIAANFYDGEWFFSEISTVTQVDGSEQPCSNKLQNKH